MRWVFHPEAESEFLESSLFYEREVPGLGHRFSHQVKTALELLIENPELGTRLDGEIRSFVIGSFPFSIIYAMDEGNPFVLALADSRRKPGHWRSRSFA